MRLNFREARRADVAAIVALMADDPLGATGETAGRECYLAAFDAMCAENANRLIVGEDAAGVIVATYQITLISGLAAGGTRRAQLESIRIAGHLRGQALGAQLMADAEERARAGGCMLLQLLMNAARTDARRFYLAHGFADAHVGLRKHLG